MSEALPDNIIIERGEDKLIKIWLRDKKTRRPLDLTNVTLLQAKFDLANRSTLTLTSTEIASVKAFVEVSLNDETVIFQAIEAGANGNLISLVFDGIQTIDQVVSAWNSANPSNQVLNNATDQNFIPAIQTITLSEGMEAYTPVQIVNDAQLGEIHINMLESDTVNLKRGDNQTFKIIIDIGPYPTGNRKIARYENRLEVRG